MKIQEIQAGSKITVNVSREGTGVSLSSTMAHAFSDCILVEPFTHEGTVVNFSIPDLAIEMIVTREGEVPYIFKNVTITRERYDNKTFHGIRCGTIGVKLNRRNAFRVFIGEHGSAIEVPGIERYDVIVKDLSSTGIGLLVDKNTFCPFAVGKHVHVMFADSVVTTRFDVAARIVRTEELENQILFGCVFVQHYPQIDRYVASKQVHQGINKNKKPAVQPPIGTRKKPTLRGFGKR